MAGDVAVPPEGPLRDGQGHGSRLPRPNRRALDLERRDHEGVCSTVPAFVTLSCTSPAGTVIVLGTNAKSSGHSQMCGRPSARDRGPASRRAGRGYRWRTPASLSRRRPYSPRRRPGAGPGPMWWDAMHR